MNVLKMSFNAFSTLEPALNQGSTTGPLLQSANYLKTKDHCFLASLVNLNIQP